MRYLQMTTVSTVIALNVIATFAPLPTPIRGALVMLAIWITGASVGCALAGK